MSKYYRYPTIIYKSQEYYIFVNVGPQHQGKTYIYKTECTKSESALLLNKMTPNQILNYDKYFTHHNFTVFENKQRDLYLGVGGMFRHQKPFNDNTRIDGLGLYVSKDLINWKYKYLILKKENFPKKFKISIESELPEFDSNLTIFYSKILKKYALICRANIKRGSRNMQFTTSSNLRKWSDFKLFKIDKYSHGDNFYMFKCIEFSEQLLFFGLAVYTNDPKKPTIISIKKMISHDLETWTDYGDLCNCPYPLYKGRSNVHIGGILNNKKGIIIFLHLNCYQQDSSIQKYELGINYKDDLLPQIKKLKIKLSPSNI